MSISKQVKLFDLLFTHCCALVDNDIVRIQLGLSRCIEPSVVV